MSEHSELQEQVQLRREKLAQLRETDHAYPNDFRRSHLANQIHDEYGQKEADILEDQRINVTVSGRMMMQRLMGKASFMHVQDMSGRIQVYLRGDDLPIGVYEKFKHWDLGDLVGVSGYLFRTKTGELSVKATDLRLLTKSLRPFPDKFHGLADQEMCYRRRYLDLIANESTRETFRIRSGVLKALRHFLDNKGFFEVETPMMHVLPGGAAARPFKTHHNALDMPLYLRIAPELYLKRLVVGGVERVYEVNRNFRNEGLSTRHNPEFTMVEFYQAYAAYEDLMDLTDEMLPVMAQEVLGRTTIEVEGQTIDLAKPFKRVTMLQSIIEHMPEVSVEMLQDDGAVRALATTLGIELHGRPGVGKIQLEIFEKVVEKQLIEPTFITAYPTEVSPLARRNDQDPNITDRFELFVGGREIANGFSELNDPDDQAERFKAQVAEREQGDDEAMWYDADYITALEYGLPPTAGEGIGIDRLVMLFAGVNSIRDVILFPLMRPKDEPDD